MDNIKLQQHVKLCKKNLNNKRVKCCANCPFEEEILSKYPVLKKLFNAKKRSLG